MMKRRCMVAAGLLMLSLATMAEATTRCLNPDLEGYRSMLREMPPGERFARHTADHPMTPPDNPDVGDSWLWYTWRLAGYPTPEVRMCTVRGEGTNVYIVVEDSQWLTRVNQADVDAMIEAWDNSSTGIHPDMGIYDIDTMYFGPVPDELDNDPKVYVLYYDFDVNADGFFWYFDEYPDGSQPFASNECEVLYMNSSDFDPGGEYLIAVQAHEFEHMIHWLADEDEVAWVNEGMAELGMWLFGHPDNIGSFPSNPDNDLTSWTGAWADYIKTYLWSLYYFEQMGGEPLPIRTLMDEPANSTTGYNNALAALGSERDFNDMFVDWTCANYLDDTALEDGQYGYVGADLPPFNAIVKNSYPVPPTNGSVNRYAADYVRFINGLPQRFWFDGTDYGIWRPRAIYMNAGTALGVSEIVLDGVDYGSIDLHDFGEFYDTFVLVVVKYSPGGSTSYQYGTEEIPAGLDDAAGSPIFAVRGAPNPLRTDGTIHLDLARPQEVRLSVLDPAGRLVREFGSSLYGAGAHAIAWDGRDTEGRVVPAGVYFVRARAEDGTAVTRWVRVE